MDTRDYSKEEVLELIEQTRERYHISDMSALGTILGEYNHNWYYYYKNHAKRKPDFLEALVAVQDPQEMFDRLRAAADRIMQKRNLEKKDMKKLYSYAVSMTRCVELSAEQFIKFAQEVPQRMEAIQDPHEKRIIAIDIIDQGGQYTEDVIKSMVYSVPLLLYFVAKRAKMIQGEMNSTKNRAKKNFDLRACYEAHCNTPEFKLSRKKNLSGEEEKSVCWYRIRCNNIKLCKFYEYSQKVKDLDICMEEIDRQYENILKSTTRQKEFMAMYQELCVMLQEIEMPEEWAAGGCLRRK